MLGEESPVPKFLSALGPLKENPSENDFQVTELADAAQLRKEGCPGLCHFVERQLYICWPFLSGAGGKEGTTVLFPSNCIENHDTRGFLPRSRVTQFQVSNIFPNAAH